MNRKFNLYLIIAQYFNKQYQSLSKFRILHPRGFDKYKYPHIQKSQTFAFVEGGGRLKKTSTQIAVCHVGGMLFFFHVSVQH